MPELREAQLERHRASIEAERNRPCPYCGGKTIFAHFRFEKGKSPFGNVPASWLHTCGSCRFSAYLTGDRKRDLQAKNAFGPTPPAGAPEGWDRDL